MQTKRNVKSNNPLQTFDITTINTTWDAFYKTVDGENRVKKLYLAITILLAAPSRCFLRTAQNNKYRYSEDIDVDQGNELQMFLKRILNRGSYCLVLIPLSMFQEWYESFTNTGYDFMPALSTIIYDKSTVAKTTNHVNCFP